MDEGKKKDRKRDRNKKEEKVELNTRKRRWRSTIIRSKGSEGKEARKK